MKILGYILCSVGLMLAVKAIFMSTSVSSADISVNNIGLLNDRLVFSIFSSTLLIIGTLIILFDEHYEIRSITKIQDSDNFHNSSETNITETETDEKDNNEKEIIVDQTLLPVCKKIEDEINKSKGTFAFGFNDKLVDLLRNACEDEKQTINLLNDYKAIYNKDLISSISGLATSYQRIKKYLMPLIDIGFLHEEYPHKRKK